MPVRPRVALVTDALSAMGGTEKVLMAALEIFPDAPIYTLVYNPKAFAGTPIADRRIVSSFINRLPGALRCYRSYLPVLPLAIEQFDFPGFDIVLSFSYAVAHGVLVNQNQVHLSYTLTPLRYAWQNVNPFRTNHGPSTWVARLILHYFRLWDVAAVNRVDRVATVSHWAAECVRRAYRQEAVVIYPPVNLERFHPLPPRGDYFITVSRLVLHKRLDLLVSAFSQLKLPLVVVGEGPEHRRLQKLAGPTVQLVGYQSDQALSEWLGRARAFVCAAEEEFGIAMVEAQASGCPVIAYAGGGAREIIQDGQTGLFFSEPTVDSLIGAIQRFIHTDHSVGFDPAALRASARHFSKERFQRELTAFMIGE